MREAWDNREFRNLVVRCSFLDDAVFFTRHHRLFDVTSPFGTVDGQDRAKDQLCVRLSSDMCATRRLPR